MTTHRLLAIFMFATFVLGGAWAVYAWASPTVGPESVEITGLSVWIIKGLLALTGILMAILAKLLQRGLTQIDERISNVKVRIDKQSESMGQFAERLARVEATLRRSIE